MNKILLLDCTLRDGGYVNNWHFGSECIDELPKNLIESGINIVELGFVRMEDKNTNRAVYTSTDDLIRFKKLKCNNDKNALLSIMIEGNEEKNNYPVEKLGFPNETGIDLIRVCTWKRLMKEHLNYCMKISNLGYKISIQPTAIDQYNDDEFIDLLILTNEVKPYSFYIVDTWGTQDSNQIVHYAKLADKYLNKEIKLGYHGHNNKMQAINCVEKIIDLNLNRDICIDSTIMGMGRGPGNLQTEVVMDFLNKNKNKNYCIDKVLFLYSKYIKSFYDKYTWGYSIYHFISANYVLPQDFASYFKENNYSIESFIKFINSLDIKEKVKYNKEFVEKRLKALNLYKKEGDM